MRLHRKAARQNHSVLTSAAYVFFRYTHCALSTKVPLGMGDLATQKRLCPSGDTSTRPPPERPAQGAGQAASRAARLLEGSGDPPLGRLLV